MRYNDRMNKQISNLLTFKKNALLEEIEFLYKRLDDARIKLNSDTLPNQLGIIQGQATRIETLLGECWGIQSTIDLLEDK